MVRKRYNLSNLSPAFSVISEVTGTNQWIKDGMTLGSILAQWNEIVGDKFKDSIKPVELKNGKLLILVPDTVWLNDIQFYKEEIIEKINKFMKSDVIKELRFSIKSRT